MWGETLGGHFSFPRTKDSTLDQGPGGGTGEKPIDLKTGGPSAVQMEAEVSDHVAPGGWKKHSKPGVFMSHQLQLQSSGKTANPFPVLRFPVFS